MLSVLGNFVLGVNVENLKVFEFAKQEGIKPLDLMDKIREWKLPVKSHMAELDPEVLQEIKEKLSQEKKGSGSKKKATKKAAKKTTKKAATKKASTKKTATKKKTAKKVAAKTTTTKKATPKLTKATGKKMVAKKEIPIEEKLIEEKPTTTRRTVIRRKKAETPVAQKTPLQESEAVQASSLPVMEEVSSETQTPPSTVVEQTIDPVAATPSVEPTTKAATQTSVDEKGKDQDIIKEKIKEKKKPRKGKVEVSIGASGLASPKPRDNIVGKVDLGNLSSTRRGTGAGAPDDENRSRTRGRNIRTGFVASQPMDFPPDMASPNQRVEKDKSPYKKAVKKGQGSTATEVPPTFAAADFRKREMVFQPKKKKVLISGVAKKTEITTPKAIKRVVKVNNSMSVVDLAYEMNVKSSQLIKVLISNGVQARVTEQLDFDTISLIAPEFNYEAVNVEKTEESLAQAIAFGDLEAEPKERPPVVTVMGHVDHGKTSLLDAIRKTDVTSGEAGGITQHIGAYSVKLEDGRMVTFVDTPGHAAFTAMRARGANVTDIVILVVAADDGVMPQTEEAINHAKTAGVPIVVAVNKIDKEGADPNKIKQQLAEHELVPEEWGGDTAFCEVSALKKTGLKELLESVLLIAEVSEFKANPLRSGWGVVIESEVIKGRGPVATILVKDGFVQTAQHIVAGCESGKVKGLMDDKGQRVKKVGPSMAVEVLGLSGAPLAGDRFDICKDEKAVKELIDIRMNERDKLKETPNSGMSLDDIFSKVKNSNLKELPVVLKTDVAGTAEAISGLFSEIGNEEVQPKIIHSGVGGVNESDVLLASTANGIVIGFNAKADTGAAAKAKERGVSIRNYSVVYELVDDIKEALARLLDPDIVEAPLGKAEVREIFQVPRIGSIAGSIVTDGVISRNCLLRLVREGQKIHEGKVSSLRRFKDDAKEVKSGFECGIGIEGYNDLQPGDVIEAYEQKEVARTLD